MGVSIDACSCRMARGALCWSQEKLADQAKVSRGVIHDFEKGSSRPHRNNMVEIVRAFQTAGIEFLKHGTRILVLPPLTTGVPMAIAAD
jgi:transcriptional regulator with XRE-family HTH domain